MTTHMDRTTFLSQAWDPYPSASNDWHDVAQFVRLMQAEGVVAGRLGREFNANSWKMTSAGRTIDVTFSESITWLRGLKQAVAVDAKFFAEGDIVALHIRRNEAAEWVAIGVLLLVPCREPWRLRSEFNFARSKQWSEFLAEIRSYFSSSGFTEALTPTLVPSPGSEPFLDPFSSDWEYGSHKETFFLPTSPEFHLKKMLAAGWTKLFEFKPCFRNGEISSHHQPEFLMLEWYRAYSDLDAIAFDVESLFEKLGSHFNLKIPVLVRTTVARLFEERCDGFILRPETSRDELTQLARFYSLAVSVDDSWDDLFFRVFLERIEPGLGHEGPLLVRGYPPSQAALSRIGADGFADRFEVYWKGLELANAFHELNDPIENELRFQKDARKKKELGKRPVPIDDELIKALRFGLPPSGGIALGVERLFMALFEIDSIENTRAFPILSPHQKL